MADLTADKQIGRSARLQAAQDIDLPSDIWKALCGQEELLRELEFLYGLLEEMQSFSAGPNLIVRKFWNTWGVFRHGVAVAGSSDIREALRRARQFTHSPQEVPHAQSHADTGGLSSPAGGPARRVGPESL